MTTETVKIKDRVSGGAIWLNVRDGVVVGAMGADPKRFVGLPVEQARRVAQARKPSTSAYQKSVLKTLEVRPTIPADLLPLFDHCVRLAADSHKNGYAKRAGQELLHARRLVRHAK
jgi:hypothetical protein